MKFRNLLVVATAACCLAACKTPTALTADATGCTNSEVEIVDSQYKREGSTTAWCARCKGKTYVCATNTTRNRVDCVEETPSSPCN
jgi:hypothetical protein